MKKIAQGGVETRRCGICRTASSARASTPRSRTTDFISPSPRLPVNSDFSEAAEHRSGEDEQIQAARRRLATAMRDRDRLGRPARRRRRWARVAVASGAALAFLAGVVVVIGAART